MLYQNDSQYRIRYFFTQEEDAEPLDLHRLLDSLSRDIANEIAHYRALGSTITRAQLFQVDDHARHILIVDTKDKHG